MSVLDQAGLEASPLADLHTIASELSIDGYRRLRKAALIGAILARQSGEPVAANDPDADADTDSGTPAAGDDESTPRRRSRRGGRSRSGSAARADADDDSGEAPADAGDAASARADAADGDDSGTDETPSRSRSSRSRRGSGRGAAKPAGDEAEADTPSGSRRGGGGGEAASGSRRGAAAADAPEETVAGVVELLPNGSGFVRVNPPEPSDDDVYISAAQVKRCELVSGDRVTGPRRKPQRSERFASLVRIDTINDRPADEVADRARFEELPAEYPSARFKFGSEDATLKAIEFLTPIGRGSRVTITGGSWAGKSHALRLLAGAIAADTELTVMVALAGVRPEELAEWTATEPAPTASTSFAASAEAQDHAALLVIDQARRVVSRGGNAVVLLDTLDGLSPSTARKVLAAARNVTGGGSLTVIATARAPIGGETTVIALDPALATTGRFPAIDLVQSGTLRADRLVGEAGANAIAAARLDALS